MGGTEKKLAQKSVDELFDIIQSLNCHVYGLYEYPKHLKQQVFFIPKEQSYESCACTADYDLKSNEFIKYSTVKQELKIDLHLPFTDLNIINELLQHPIYEIRKINLETLQNLTQKQ